MKKPAAFLLAVALLAGRPGAGAPPASPEVEAWRQRAARVTITRDDWGIPHVAAKTDADAIFGMMYAQAEDDFPRVEANLVNAGLNLEYCTITAPVGGRTGKLVVKVGNLVKANDDDALVTINRIRPIYATFSVPAQHLPAILARRADGIAVRAVVPGLGETVSNGALTFVDNAVDAATATILLKATFPNDDEHLWPGQFVELTVVLGEEPDRVVCPAPAVQTGQQRQYVFVVKDDSTVRQIQLSIWKPGGIDHITIREKHPSALENGYNTYGQVVISLRNGRKRNLWLTRNADPSAIVETLRLHSVQAQGDMGVREIATKKRTKSPSSVFNNKVSP